MCDADDDGGMGRESMVVAPDVAVEVVAVEAIEDADVVPSLVVAASNEAVLDGGDLIADLSGALR